MFELQDCLKMCLATQRAPRLGTHDSTYTYRTEGNLPSFAGTLGVEGICANAKVRVADALVEVLLLAAIEYLL